MSQSTMKQGAQTRFRRKRRQPSPCACGDWWTSFLTFGSSGSFGAVGEFRKPDGNLFCSIEIFSVGVPKIRCRGYAEIVLLALVGINSHYSATRTPVIAGPDLDGLSTLIIEY